MTKREEAEMLDISKPRRPTVREWETAGRLYAAAHPRDASIMAAWDEAYAVWDAAEDAWLSATSKWRKAIANIRDGEI